MNDRHYFCIAYHDREKLKFEIWNNYFAKHGNGIRRSAKIQKMIRLGIPNQFRGK